MEYLIIKVDELSKVNFNEVFQKNTETVNISEDGVYTVIKWDEDIPTFIDSLNFKIGPFDNSKIIQEMLKLNWYNQDNE